MLNAADDGRLQRVLVTGAAGFVGRGVCRSLTQTGYEVVGLVRGIPPESDHLPDVRYVVGDIRAAASLPMEAFEGCTHIIHCVGIIAEVHGRGQTFEAVHVGGTDNLLRAARRAEVRGRFVYISALGANRKSRSRYAQTKAQAEELVREGGLPWTIFQPSVVLGAGADFLHQMEGLIRRPPLTPFPLPFVPVPGSGKNRFQPVALSDLASCVVGCLSDPATVSQTYQVGGADEVSFNDLIKAIAARIGVQKRLLHLPLPLLFAAAPVLESLLPVPPVTTDQLFNLQRDNVCDIGPLCAAFRIAPLGFEAALDNAYKK